MIITLAAWCGCSGSRVRGSITTSSTRTRSFSSRTRWEDGAATSASIVFGHGHGGSVVMSHLAAAPGPCGQGGLGVGTAVGLGVPQSDHEGEAHVVARPNPVQECLIGGDDDVEALHCIGDNRPGSEQSGIVNSPSPGARS